MEEDVTVKCQWLSNMNIPRSDQQRSKVTFLWRDSRSPEKGFLPVCWTFFVGSGKCNKTFIYQDHQFSEPEQTEMANNDTMLIKNIKYTGDVMCRFTVDGWGDTFSTKEEAVTVKGRLSAILHKMLQC